MHYYYVITFSPEDYGCFDWRLTITEGQFSIGSILEEGFLVLNWKEITREQAEDLLGDIELIQAEKRYEESKNDTEKLSEEWKPLKILSLVKNSD